MNLFRTDWNKLKHHGRVTSILHTTSWEIWPWCQIQENTPIREIHDTHYTSIKIISSSYLLALGIDIFICHDDIPIVFVEFVYWYNCWIERLMTWEYIRHTKLVSELSELRFMFAQLHSGQIYITIKRLLFF